MKQLTATALLALVALFAASAGEAAAGHHEPTLLSEGTWKFAGLSPAARANVAADVAATIPSAQPLLDLIDGSVAIDADAPDCHGIGTSCSFPTPNDATTPWRIHLSADVLAGTYPSQRFLTLHEIGHAVWGLIFSQRDRDTFVADVERSLAGKRCKQWRNGGRCAIVPEMFADEFARWAGGFRVSMTDYETPALLKTATFSALINTAMVRWTSPLHTNDAEATQLLAASQAVHPVARAT